VLLGQGRDNFLDEADFGPLACFYNDDNSRTPKTATSCRLSTQLVRMLCLHCSKGLSAIHAASIRSRIMSKPVLKRSAKRYTEAPQASLGPSNSLQNLQISLRTLETDNIPILLRFQTICHHSRICNNLTSRRCGHIRSPPKDINTSSTGNNTDTLWTPEYIQSKPFC
jgi:hypothetical protein